MSTVGQAFIERSKAYLTSDYLPKLRRCTDRIGEEDLWWRPNAASNSVGNLLLHLSGNLRQWVVSGIGGAPDVRKREEEFNAEGGRGAPELMATLEETLNDVVQVLDGLDPELLLEPRVIQGRRLTVLEALYHAVEHFAVHTGQIVYITKLRTGRDLGFYEVEGGIARPSW